MTERVLVVAAHPDDETLGCGGTIAKHVKAGDVVCIVVLSGGVASRGIDPVAYAFRQRNFKKAMFDLGVADSRKIADFPDNAFDSIPQLDVAQTIEDVVSRFRPTIVYTHWPNDLNVDHRITGEAVQVACRPQPGSTVKRLLFFEVPSSTEWQSHSRAAFVPNWFVDIGDTVDQKLEALKAYGSEMRDYPHARSLEAVGHLMAWRGASVGLACAEAFVLARGLA